MNLANPETTLAFTADEIAFPRADGRQDDLGLVAKAVVQRARVRAARRARFQGQDLAARRPLPVRRRRARDGVRPGRRDRYRAAQPRPLLERRGGAERRAPPALR